VCIGWACVPLLLFPDAPRGDARAPRTYRIEFDVRQGLPHSHRRGICAPRACKRAIYRSHGCARFRVVSWFAKSLMLTPPRIQTSPAVHTLKTWFSVKCTTIMDRLRRTLSCSRRTNFQRIISRMSSTTMKWASRTLYAARCCFGLGAHLFCSDATMFSNRSGSLPYHCTWTCTLC
jgi:hypothetical protein